MPSASLLSFLTPWRPAMLAFSKTNVNFEIALGRPGQASSGRRRPRCPRPRTSQKFSKIDVLGRPRPRPGPRPGRPRPKNSQKSSSSDVLVPVLVLVLAVLVPKFSKIVVLGRPRPHPRPNPGRPRPRTSPSWTSSGRNSWIRVLGKMR